MLFQFFIQQTRPDSCGSLGRSSRIIFQLTRKTLNDLRVTQGNTDTDKVAHLLFAAQKFLNAVQQSSLSFKVLPQPLQYEGHGRFTGLCSEHWFSTDTYLRLPRQPQFSG
jgi:hypothetical protein